MTVHLPRDFYGSVYAVLPPQPASYCHIVLGLQMASTLSHTGENLLQSAILTHLEYSAFFWKHRGKVTRQNLPFSFRKFQHKVIFKTSQ